MRLMNERECNISPSLQSLKRYQHSNNEEFPYVQDELLPVSYLSAFLTSRSELMDLSFADLYGGQPAQDRVRGQKIPATSPSLDILGM